MKIFLIYTALSLFPAATAFCFSSVISLHSLQTAQLGGHWSYYQAPEGTTLTAEEALQLPDSVFTILFTSGPDFGVASRETWFRFTLLPDESLMPWALIINYQSLDQITLYRVLEDNSVLKVIQTGSLHPLSDDELMGDSYILPLNFEDNNPHTYLLKIHTDGIFNVPASLISREELAHRIPSSNAIMGVIFGILIVMVVYNFFLFLALKDRTYLYYCAFISANIIVHSGLTGFHRLFFPSVILPQNVTLMAMFLTTFFALRFSMRFLDLRKTDRPLHRLVNVFAWFNILHVIPGYFLPFQYLLWVMVIQMFIVPPCILIASIRVWHKGHRSSRYFVLAWALYLAFSVVVSIDTFLPDSGMDSVDFLRAGALIEAVLLSFALADRINVLRFERETAKNQLLAAAKNHQELIEQHNKELEQKVNLRTRELEEKQLEVIRKNDLLEKQTQVIEQQNHELITQAENLERLVRERTLELTEANMELVRNNVQLEQYAYVTSHNLRGPIASLLGLLQLIDRSNLDNEINHQTLHHLDLAAANLDAISKDLSKILNIKNGIGSVFEMVETKQLIQKAISRMANLLEQNKVLLRTEYCETPDIKTVPAYFYSIFYNLISNAVKYHHPDRQPSITVRTCRKNDWLVIEVEDNGLGMDLDTYGEKLFGLYQRFHLHKEGKGLGLYLVKTQMELLQGKIEVDSTPGIGTTFRLFFQAEPILVNNS